MAAKAKDSNVKHHLSSAMALFMQSPSPQLTFYLSNKISRPSTGLLSFPDYNNSREKWKRFRVDSQAVDHIQAKRGQPIIEKKTKNDKKERFPKFVHT